MSENAVMWILGNAGRALFTHAQVLELADDRLTHDTLQNWANREIVVPENDGYRRRYDGVALVQACLGIILVSDTTMSPMRATIALNQAMLLLIRNLVDPAKVEPKAGDVPIDQVHRFYCVIGPAGQTPSLVRADGIAKAMKGSASTVFPFGALLVDLAKRAQKMADDLGAGSPSIDIDQGGVLPRAAKASG